MSISGSKKTSAQRVQKAHQTSRNLEDCEPGATRKEVLQFIEKVAKSPKPSRKHDEPPAPGSP